MRYMHRRAFLAAAGASLLAAPRAFAQQRRVPRIAYLSANPPMDWRVEEFLKGMAEQGHAEGRTFSIEYFHAPTPADLPGRAATAVATGPDIIVAINTQAALDAKRATATIPVVFAGVGDALATGLVSNLARPGGNLTGPHLMLPDSEGKRLQLLTQLVPGLKRATVFVEAGNAVGTLALAILETAAKALFVDVHVIELRSASDVVAAFARATDYAAQAIVLTPSPLLVNNYPAIATLAIRESLAAVSSAAEFAIAGGLLSYGPSLPENYRRAGYYVDRILKGAKPQDLPVEQPREFDFVINKKTANALGLSIPLGLWVQATEIIE
jgi:putative tryptophan/tyrosine transport system substrate-binding protein